MSAFEDDVLDDLPSIYADAGDLVDYQGSGFTVNDVLAIKDNGFEVYDQDQVAMRVTTFSLQAVDVPTSRQGDQIITPSRTWTVQQILEDDGFERRLWVS